MSKAGLDRHNAAVLKQLAPNIFWMAPEHATDRPALGAIAGDEHTLLVDAGASVQHARQFQDALAAHSLPPLSHVVLTHSHWDHVFGASAIDAVAVATEPTAEILRTMATYEWSDGALDERVAADLEIPFCRDMIKAELSSEERAAMTIRVPDETFLGVRGIDLGNRWAHIVQVGGDHAPDSCIVVVPGAVAFLSDCVYPNIHTEPAYRTRRHLYPLLDRLLKLDVEHYVLGHGDAPLTRAEFESLASELKTAGDAVAKDPACPDAPTIAEFRAGLAHEGG